MYLYHCSMYKSHKACHTFFLKENVSRLEGELHFNFKGDATHLNRSLILSGQIIPPRNTLPTAVESDNRVRPPASPPPTLRSSPATLTAL
ncbi:hypothetical protein HanIR_Chr08g0345911 [Helianthus annuus]|nr:hypothetical protein HanIR_Chr08g0345911 [Helianthus annuus]